MSEGEITRIAVLEANQNNIMEKIEEILNRFDKFEEKLDKALEKKADKVEVDRIRNNIQWIAYTVIGAVVVGIISFTMFK